MNAGVNSFGAGEVLSEYVVTQEDIDQGVYDHKVTQDDLDKGLHAGASVGDVIKLHQVGEKISVAGPLRNFDPNAVPNSTRLEGLVHVKGMEESLEEAREKLNAAAHATVSAGQSSLSTQEEEKVTQCLQDLFGALQDVVDLNKHIAYVKDKPQGLDHKVDEKEMKEDKFKLEQTSDAFKRFEAAFQKLDDKRETRTLFQAMAHVWSKITHALKGMSMSASTKAHEYGSAAQTKLSQAAEKVGGFFHSKSEGDGKKEEPKPSTPTPGGGTGGGDGGK